MNTNTIQATGKGRIVMGRDFMTEEEIKTSDIAWAKKMQEREEEIRNKNIIKWLVFPFIAVWVVPMWIGIWISNNYLND